MRVLIMGYANSASMTLSMQRRLKPQSFKNLQRLDLRKKILKIWTWIHFSTMPFFMQDLAGMSSHCTTHNPMGRALVGNPIVTGSGSIHGSKNGRTKPLRMRISSGSGGRSIQKPTSESSPGRNPAFSYWISIQAQA